jgi:uncharacterized protein (TIGR04255 family)
MTKNIPAHLKKSPIIESIFEIRYTSDNQVTAILPGILHEKLDGKKTMLPVPPIPIDIVKMDPNMQGIPSFSLDWDKYIILGNPHYVAISAKQPYTSWTNFKNGIKYIHNIIFNGDLFNTITRYSIKYVDFIEIPPLNTAMDLLNIEININDLTIKNENLMLQLELYKDNYLHVVKVATSATVMQQNIGSQLQKIGLLIDTDTLDILKNPILPNDFIANSTSCLDKIHIENKNMFFSILSDKCIDILEPTYDA